MASSAREQTDYIARHVGLYSDVLELLAQRIDDDEPIHSNKALNLVDRIYHQSQNLFKRIEDLLPNRMTFLQKIKWSYSKSKADLLVAEIEYLKSTVHLLVNVLYAGKKIRSYNRKKGSQNAKDDVDVQCTKVQNAIVEQLAATDTRADLQAKVDKEEALAIDSGEGRTEQAISKIRVQVPVLQQEVAITEFRQTLASAQTASEERAIVMQRSADLLEELLAQWTTLASQFNDSKTSSEGRVPRTGHFGHQEDKGKPDTPGDPPKDVSGKAAQDSAGERHHEMLTKANLEAHAKAMQFETEVERTKAEEELLEQRSGQAASPRQYLEPGRGAGSQEGEHTALPAEPEQRKDS
ncbi:hypothetical protein LTS15_004883 [Exophiala xenobiotica]|nr:hypothetical protein LTS15_004883 [Exophiala xenobiotica]